MMKLRKNGTRMLTQAARRRTLCIWRFFASQPLPLKRPTNTPSPTTADPLQSPAGSNDPPTCSSALLLCVHSGPAAGRSCSALASEHACPSACLASTPDCPARLLAKCPAASAAAAVAAVASASICRTRPRKAGLPVRAAVVSSSLSAEPNRE